MKKLIIITLFLGVATIITIKIALQCNQTSKFNNKIDTLISDDTTKKEYTNWFKKHSSLLSPKAYILTIIRVSRFNDCWDETVEKLNTAINNYPNFSTKKLTPEEHIVYLAYKKNNLYKGQFGPVKEYIESINEIIK